MTWKRGCTSEYIEMPRRGSELAIIFIVTLLLLLVEEPFRILEVPLPQLTLPFCCLDCSRGRLGFLHCAKPFHTLGKS
jgi:hypothetical protein